MTDFFSADQHFSHKNILKYCHRPFKDVHEMNKTIVDNWNNVVAENDTVYVLGDVAMHNRAQELQPIVERLKGHKILILGNHDAIKPFDYLTVGFESVHTSLAYNEDIFLAHDPSIFDCIKNQFQVLLCGHVHGLFIKLANNRVYNVGVDVRNFTPVTLEEILK